MTYDPSRSNLKKRVYTTESKDEAKSFANRFYGFYIQFLPNLYLVII